MNKMQKQKRKYDENVTVKKPRYCLLFEYLPNEVLYIIIGLVPVEFKPSIELTCSLFRSIEINQKRKMCRWNPASGNPCTTIEYVKWEIENGFLYDVGTTYRAAKCGNLKLLKFLDEKNCRRNINSCLSAARGGHLEALKWLHNNGYSWCKCTCLEAAKNGQLECLQWLHENGCPYNRDECLSAADENNHSECLEYLLQQDKKI